MENQANGIDLVVTELAMAEGTACGCRSGCERTGLGYPSF